MNILGDNLRKKRLELDMTQEEVAAVINKARETYNRYELGTLLPDIKTLVLLANLYETTLDELTGRDLKYMIKTLYQIGQNDSDELNEKIQRKRASKRKKKKEAQ